MLSEQDEEHLKLLTIFHYVFAGFSAFGALVPILYVMIASVIFGAAVATTSEGMAHAGIFGGVLIAIGLVVSACLFASAFIQFLVGRFIAQRRHYSFCFIVSIVQLIFFPLGTILGIFTILVLNRPQVKAALTSTGLLA